MTASINSDSHLQVKLASDFRPSPYTVVVGRGKIVQENIGNQRLRVLASGYAAHYQKATDRKTKIQIVDEINRTIKSAGGMFVRLDTKGHWYKVSETVAREKIGYVLRDLLCDNYKSSSKSKVARRCRKGAQGNSPCSASSECFSVEYQNVPTYNSSLDKDTKFLQFSESQKDWDEVFNVMLFGNNLDLFGGLLDSILDDFDADLLLKAPLLSSEI